MVDYLEQLLMQLWERNEDEDEDRETMSLPHEAGVGRRQTGAQPDVNWEGPETAPGGLEPQPDWPERLTDGRRLREMAGGRYVRELQYAEQSRERSGDSSPPEAEPETAGERVWRQISRSGDIPRGLSPEGDVLRRPASGPSEDPTPVGVAERVLDQLRPSMPAAGESQVETLNRTRGGTVALAAPPAGGLQEETAGLRTLYRQVRAASWGENAVQTAGVAVTQEAVLPETELRLGQLDRAMRRDSRRYDGGMTIY